MDLPKTYLGSLLKCFKIFFRISPGTSQCFATGATSEYGNSSRDYSKNFAKGKRSLNLWISLQMIPKKDPLKIPDLCINLKGNSGAITGGMLDKISAENFREATEEIYWTIFVETKRWISGVNPKIPLDELFQTNLWKKSRMSLSWKTSAESHSANA